MVDAERPRSDRVPSQLVHHHDVVTVDREEHQDEDAHEQHRQPAPRRELRDRDDQQHDAGRHGPDDVDHDRAAPEPGGGGAEPPPPVQGTPIPLCDSVNDMNTPITYSWISRVRSASNARMMIDEAIARTRMPLEKRSRSPRFTNCRGM